MTENNPPEPARAPEKMATYVPHLGIQGRFAMGVEALSPNKTVDLKVESILDNASPLVDLLQKKSIQERTEQTRGVTHDEWKAKTVEKIHKIPKSTLGRDHADFFVKMKINTTTFSDDQAQEMYDRYFSVENEGRGLEQFLTDVATAYGNDIPGLRKNLTAVQWMAGMFGNAHSNELISNFIDQQLELQKVFGVNVDVSDVNKQMLVNKCKGNVNALSEKEISHLAFLTDEDPATISPARLKKTNNTPPPQDDELLQIDEIGLGNLDELRQNNGKGATQYLNIMRYDLKDTSHPDFVVNNFNMPIRKLNGYFEVSPFASRMGDLYDLPLGIMVKNSHAYLITNGPHKKADKWYLSVWNPFNNGTDEVELYEDYSDPKTLQAAFSKEKDVNADKPDYIINSQWLKGYQADQNSSNLEGLLDKPEFAGVREELHHIKFAGLQKTAQDCVPLCGYLAAILNRLSDTSPFVTQQGMDKFEHDFRIHIKTKGEIAAGGIPLAHTQEDLLKFIAKKATFAEVDMNGLAQEYGKNPLEFIKKMQTRTHERVLIMKKDGESEAEIKRVVGEFLEVQVLLDHMAFPPDDTVKKGVLPYLPDGLSDMGSDNEIDNTKRTREKIRIDKQKTFENSIDLFYQIMTTQFSPAATEKNKHLWMTKMVAAYIHNKIKYDYQDELARISMPGQSVLIGLAAHEDDLKLGVCRHHALDTQVVLQSLGVDSRLMKSDLDALGAHVNNLVHIESDWYLLDTTNPEFKGDGTPIGSVFLKPILPLAGDTTIDLNAHNYVWEVEKTEQDGTKKKRKYASRNNMYYRVRDNRKNPAPSHYVK